MPLDCISQEGGAEAEELRLRSEEHARNLEQLLLIKNNFEEFDFIQIGQFQTLYVFYTLQTIF